MTLAVKRIIHKEVENKYVTSYPARADASQPGQPWAAAGTGVLQVPSIRNNVTLSNIVPIMPPIAQGLTDSSRVGDKIRPLSMSIHFDVSMFSKNVNANFLLVRLLCLSDKAIKTTLDLPFTAGSHVGTPVDTQLFDYGNGVNGGFNGSPYDVNWRVNRKRYTVHHDRVFKLVKGYGQLPHSTNEVPYAGSVQCIDHWMTQRFTLKIKCPKELKYQTDLDLFPTNFAPFWAVGFVQPDGDGTVDYLANQIMVNYTTHFDYEDA